MDLQFDPDRTMARYTDLSWTQWWVLKQAAKGALNTVQTFRRDEVFWLIDENTRTLTPYGRKLYELARQIENNTFVPLVRPALDVDSSLTARNLRKQPEYKWVRSVHIKILKTLWQYPFQTYKFLGRVYGYEAVIMLLRSGLVDGDMHLGCPFDVTEEGCVLLGVKKEEA